MMSSDPSDSRQAPGTAGNQPAVDRVRVSARYLLSAGIWIAFLTGFTGVALALKDYSAVFVSALIGISAASLLASIYGAGVLEYRADLLHRVDRAIDALERRSG
jgi:hypothetical protein